MTLEEKDKRQVRGQPGPFWPVYGLWPIRKILDMFDPLTNPPDPFDQPQKVHPYIWEMKINLNFGKEMNSMEITRLRKFDTIYVLKL